MEISFARRSFSFLKLSRYHKNVKYIFRMRSTVEVSHKTYGSPNWKNPIIIIHGLLGSKRNWATMSESLKNACDRVVIAVDARNHGDSPHSPSHHYLDLAADIKQLMTKLSIKEAVVLGHSMGGRAAMVLALTEPSIVSHLIVVDISPVSSPSLLKKNFFPSLIDAMKSIKFDDVKDIAAAREMAKQRLQSSGLDLDAGTINFVLMNFGQKDGKIDWKCNMDALKNHFDHIATFPTEVAGKVYKGPTLFIVGNESHFVPKDDLKSIQEIFPLAAMVFVDGAGHNVHVDQPDEFINIVSNFLTKHSK